MKRTDKGWVFFWWGSIFYGPIRGSFLQWSADLRWTDKWASICLGFFFFRSRARLMERINALIRQEEEKLTNECGWTSWPESCPEWLIAVLEALTDWWNGWESGTLLKRNYPPHNERPMTFYRPKKHERTVYQNDRWTFRSIRRHPIGERNIGLISWGTSLAKSEKNTLMKEGDR